MPAVPYQTLLIALVLLVIGVFIYRPIMKIARRDMAARTAAGQSNALVYTLLLLPVFGPLLYLLFRRALLPRE